MEFIECTRRIDGKKFTALQIATSTNLWYIITEWDVLTPFLAEDFEKEFEIG